MSSTFLTQCIEVAEQRLPWSFTAVAESRVGWYFRLDGCGHPRERKGSRFLVEIRAGLTTAAGKRQLYEPAPPYTSSCG